MKKILIVLVAMLIGISFFNIEAKAQNGSGCDSMLVYEDDCYTVIAHYCYEIYGSVINIDVHDVQFIKKYVTDNSCDGFSIVDIYRHNYNQMMEEWVDMILADIAQKDPDFPFNFCKDGVSYDLNITTAPCLTDQPIILYWKQIRFNELVYWVPVFSYRPCAEDAKCLSLYTLCWEWDSGTLSLRPVKKLINRRSDINNSCPEAKVFMTSPGPFEIKFEEIPCSVTCE